MWRGIEDESHKTRAIDFPPPTNTKRCPTGGTLRESVAVRLMPDTN
jgi:hypothetical protein